MKYGIGVLILALAQPSFASPQSTRVVDQSSDVKPCFVKISESTYINASNLNAIDYDPINKHVAFIAGTSTRYVKYKDAMPPFEEVVAKIKKECKF